MVEYLQINYHIGSETMKVWLQGIKCLLSDFGGKKIEAISVCRYVKYWLREIYKWYYSPCFLTWPFSSECAVGLVESINRDKDCRECMGYNRALATVRHTPSNDAFTAIAPLLRAQSRDQIKVFELYSFFLFGGVGLNPLRSLCRSPRFV
jgi:hypothetical protein